MVGETRDLETAQICHPGVAHRASGLHHAAHERRARRGHALDRHGRGAVPHFVHARSRARPAVAPQHLSATAARLISRAKRCSRSSASRRRDIGDKNFYLRQRLRRLQQTGYKGRKGIYELLKITDPLRELINERAPTVILKQKAIELGMVTLRQDGLRSIFAGDTTIEEVLKYT